MIEVKLNGEELIVKMQGKRLDLLTETSIAFGSVIEKLVGGSPDKEREIKTIFEGVLRTMHYMGGVE